MIGTSTNVLVWLIKDISYKVMEVWVSPGLMMTQHIGDEYELLTADQWEANTAEPEQAEQGENTAQLDPVETAEPDEVPREMECSLPTPTAFNINATDLFSDWKRWSSVFQIYAIASDLKKKEDPVQRATILHCLGPTVQCIFNTLPGEHKSLEDTKTALNGYFALKQNMVAEH